MSNLKATYNFKSPTTQNTYVLEVETGPLTNPIQTLDNPNCVGWLIISGTFTTIINNVQTPYNVPSGAATAQSNICNGLWQSAAVSPDGPGSPWCNGIDQLFIFASQVNLNTSIWAIDSNSIGINFEGILTDTANLVSSEFPPQ